MLWEDDKWLNHPTGSTLASVQTALENTPGSFWTDGTTMYCHPFDDTNPATDGKIYTRSYYRNGGSALLISAPDVHLDGFKIRKTCIADKSTNDPGSNYCFQGQSAFGGTSLIENCYGDYGSKHIFGFTDNDTARQVTVRNCQAEQGTPYNSQSPWVDYSSLNVTGTATTNYVTCTTTKCVGLIGSTLGNNGGGQAWLSHNNGSANFQFAQINFTNCDFGSGTVDTYGAVHTVRWKGGSCGGGVLRSPDSLIEQALIVTDAASSNVPTNDTPAGTTRVRNCIIIPARLQAGFESVLQGNLEIEGCTIDLRNTASNGNQLALFKRYAAFNLTWKNNVILFSNDKTFGVLRDGSSTDTITFSNNAYTTASNIIVFNYNDGTTTADRTLAQWKNLGMDTDSIASNDLKLATATYFPLAGSAVINAGSNLGPLADYSGFLYSTRNDIGAWEFLTPVETWRKQYFNNPDNVGTGADTNIVANDNLPNLLKYATGLNPLVPGVAPIMYDIDSGCLRLSVQKDPQATDVTYLVEVTDDLTSAEKWTTVGTTAEADTATELSVHDNTPVTDSASRFLRLRVIRQP